MKTILYTTIAFILTFNCKAQNDVELVYSNENIIALMDMELSAERSMEDILKIIGEGTLIKEYPTGKKVYHYEELGMAVHTVNDKLLFIGANFNWDGDKNFPEKSFTGKLMIDNVEFNTTTKEAALEDIKAFQINCLFPGMCMTDPKKENPGIIIGFKDGVVTQVGFEFH